MGEISEERFDERVESRKSRSSKTRGLSSMDHHIKAAETERVRSRKHHPRSGKQLSDVMVTCQFICDVVWSSKGLCKL